MTIDQLLRIADAASACDALRLVLNSERSLGSGGVPPSSFSMRALQDFFDNPAIQSDIKRDLAGAIATTIAEAVQRRLRILERQIEIEVQESRG